MHLLNPALSTSAADVPFPTDIAENQKPKIGAKKGGMGRFTAQIGREAPAVLSCRFHTSTKTKGDSQLIVEIATVITAVATACGALYAARSFSEQMKRSAPAMRVHSARRAGDFALIHLSVFPANHHVVIRRISSNAAGVALAPHVQDSWTGDIKYEPSHEHFSSVDVDFDLLPSHISSASLTLHLSVKLRRDQSSVRISLHNSLSRFAVKHKIAAIIKSEIA